MDIGDASPQEIRWWTAVLAPGRGWEATLVVGKQTFWSPWSIRVESGPRLIVPRGNDALPSTRVRSSPRLIAPRGNDAVPSTRALTNRTPSFAEAFSFLNNFCSRHNIGDQSDAALAAVLLLPTMGKTRKGLMLPAVVVSDQPPSPHFLAQIPLASHLPANWMPHLRRHIDKLMTLSCYNKGIRPMLLGAFYNPDIECNAVSPWLQGTLAVLNALTSGGKPLLIARMLMDRNPNVAFLWVGATVLGLQHYLFEEVRHGHIPASHLSAEWSGKVQSFVQQPVSSPMVAPGSGTISRADEGRLLHLAQTKGRTAVPRCPWKPFGATPLEDTDVAVRLHADCVGHGLQYRGLVWNCVGGRVESGGWDGNLNRNGDLRPALLPVLVASEETSVDFSRLSIDDEVLSARATRIMFGWLRTGGFAEGERGIWQHEWFQASHWRLGDRASSPSEESSERESTCRSELSFQSQVHPAEDDNRSELDGQEEEGLPALSAPIPNTTDTAAHLTSNR